MTSGTVALDGSRGHTYRATRTEAGMLAVSVADILATDIGASPMVRYVEAPAIELARVAASFLDAGERLDAVSISRANGRTRFEAVIRRAKKASPLDASAFRSALTMASWRVRRSHTDLPRKAETSDND